MKLKWILYGVLGMVVLFYVYSGSDSANGESYENEEIVTPTQGLITTVQQVSDSTYKIEDEQTVPTPEESRIIAKHLDNTVDTLTLEEAKLSSIGTEGDYQGSNRYIYRAVSYGLMGYMLGRSMSRPPMSGAYMDQRTYDRVNNNAGQNLRNTANRQTVRRPSTGKSGYGSSKSSRSFGG